MGREAVCRVEIGTQDAKSRVLLESDAIHVRGTLKATFPFAELTALRVAGEELCAETPWGALRLHLGAAEAARWLDRIANPVTLASKLGLRSGQKVTLLGAADADISGVLAGASAEFVAPAVAELAFVAVESEEALMGLEAALTKLRAETPVWVLRTKGKGAAVSESTLMAEMRLLGYGPAKTARWSQSRAADRYHRR